MKKYFYLVLFKYLKNENNIDESTFDLGVFSSKKYANRKISNSLTKKGFIEYPLSNFKIIKFAVDFQENNIIKSNTILYCVTHEYFDDIDEKYVWNIFDYYSTYERAQEEIVTLRHHNKIGKKYPNNFEIVEIYIDNFNSWSEGFEKYDYKTGCF